VTARRNPCFVDELRLTSVFYEQVNMAIAGVCWRRERTKEAPGSPHDGHVPPFARFGRRPRRLLSTLPLEALLCTHAVKNGGAVQRPYAPPLPPTSNLDLCSHATVTCLVMGRVLTFGRTAASLAVGATSTAGSSIQRVNAQPCLADHILSDRDGTSCCDDRVFTAEGDPGCL
jgi:hypothetical protein